MTMKTMMKIEGDIAQEGQDATPRHLERAPLEEAHAHEKETHNLFGL
jgi:hypothetical protein